MTGSSESVGDPPTGFMHSAFVVQDEAESVASLRAHLSQLQLVFPDWLSFANEDGRIDVKIGPDLARMLKSSGVQIMPRISNTDAAGKWYEDELPEFFRDRDVSDIFIDNLLAALTTTNAAGVNLDIEAVHAGDKGAYVAWLAKVADALHFRGFRVTVDVPLNDEAFDYEAIGRLADAVVVMGYDQHYAGGSVGPIAARSWFEDGVRQVLKSVPPEKVILGIGAYGYDWMQGAPEAAAVGFSQALALAGRYGARIETDPDSVNSRFRYTDERGRTHEVWLLDAVSAWNEYQAARDSKVMGVALWRTGLEDPSLWTFYGSPTSQLEPSALTTVPAADTVTFHGTGELLRVRDDMHDGRRSVRAGGKFIDWAEYSALPRAYQVERFGAGKKKQLALTFDDGPDPRWTPAILNVLQKYDAKATFFVVGDQAERFPDLLADELRFGNLVGNHTFSHPDLKTVSAKNLDYELNTTQRLIEAATGRASVLFRSPYDTDSEPVQPAQLAALREVDKLGYVAVAADADSEDYLRPGSAGIVANVLAALDKGNARIVVFHDGGGDRQQTVDALEVLIPKLRAAGYDLVSLGTLMGVPETTLMPSPSSEERVLVLGARVLLWLRIYGASLLVYLFAATTLVAAARIVTLGVLVARRQRAAKQARTGQFEPPVCVLIPAYNEGKVIGRTLNALLQSDYQRLSVLVVDDGSTDSTPRIVEEYSERDPRVSLMCQSNAGKAAALNRALEHVQEEIVITIDADTLVLPHTVRCLVEPMSDPAIDAVCGNVQVGNARNLITAFQSLEYVTSQNYDRRAFDSLNCISVVPGATGAWRRKAVLAVGGYSTDTLTEDADLTLAVLTNGGRITYAPKAQSITEAPETVSALFRQRFRWSFGTLQCMWKHRRRFGHGTLGCVALPNMFLFQALFPLLAPLGDIILLRCLLRCDLDPVAVGYLTFLLMDFIGSAVAYALDSRPLRETWVVLVQRLYYRQFLYVVTFAAVLAVARGRRHGWDKLKRTGSVVLAQA